MNSSTKNVRHGLLVAAIAIFAIIAATQPASADRRIFPRTYPYMTLPQGAMEAEHYLDAKYVDIGDSIEVDWQHEIEFEYGITDHTDIGFYNVFRQKPGQSMKYRGIKLRTRHRFAEEGDWPVDLGVYLEVVYFDDEFKIEEKLLMAKTFGNLELDLNLKLEHEFKEAPGGDMYQGDYRRTVTEFAPILGVGYHVTEKFAVGIEYYAETVFEDEEWGPYVQYLGPTVSVATKKFFWTIGFQPQITGFNDEVLFQARSLFGVYL